MSATIAVAELAAGRHEIVSRLPGGVAGVIEARRPSPDSGAVEKGTMAMPEALGSAASPAGARSLQRPRAGRMLWITAAWGLMLPVHRVGAA